jgi:hypothetical protein
MKAIVEGGRYECIPNCGTLSWLRWINTRGEKGPWSDPVSATIAG